MVDANLYLDSIDLSLYISEQECKKCGADSCRQLVEKIKNNGCRSAQNLGLSNNELGILQQLCHAERVMPAVQSLQLPQPGLAGLLEINDPADVDPVLVTGNSRLTQEVLLAVLSTTLSPFYVLCVDTNGDTVDMAVILGSFTPERIEKAIEKECLIEKVSSSHLVLPGLAKKLKKDLAHRTGWSVEVGPVCAAELPLVFGDKWLPA